MTTTTTKSPKPFDVKTKAQTRAWLKSLGLRSLTLPGRRQTVSFNLATHRVTVTNLKGKFVVSRQWFDHSGKLPESLAA